MQFATFYQLPCASHQSPLQRYEDTMIQIQHADALGFDVAWLAELHFYPDFSIMPSPLLVASALSQRTRRIRLGIAVNLLPLHNPLRNAEDAATLDLLSHGRLEYGAGRGSLPHHFAGYNVPLEESRQRFLEALDVILLAWTSTAFSYEGKYYRYPRRAGGAQAAPEAPSAAAHCLQQLRVVSPRGGARLAHSVLAGGGAQRPAARRPCRIRPAARGPTARHAGKTPWPSCSLCMWRPRCRGGPGRAQSQYHALLRGLAASLQHAASGGGRRRSVARAGAARLACNA
ncbi:MAG: hypothetical protein KatS3mg131_0697 [Candidatus Tectimicrobiota bacterium]|nr:MAG: hypothetical protein KatS3mg131_0697 [Candidatus Tectomicrobia bacterium]